VAFPEVLRVGAVQVDAANHAELKNSNHLLHAFQPLGVRLAPSTIVSSRFENVFFLLGLALLHVEKSVQKSVGERRHSQNKHEFLGHQPQPRLLSVSDRGSVAGELGCAHEVDQGQPRETHHYAKRIRVLEYLSGFGANTEVSKLDRLTSVLLAP